MVKCVVSRCPNRMVSVNRGVFHRPRKRFFNFPKDPARVKVWLAALRETDQQDASEQHFICEDHFLPEDLSTNGIVRDAIPIMPPWLDGTLGPLSSWRAGSSEEEENEDNEEEEEEESGDEAPTALDPAQQNPVKGPEKAPEVERTSASLPQMNLSEESERQDVSLELLTRRFLELMLAAPGSALDLRDAAENLQTYKQRVYDIMQVLKGLDLVQKEQTSWVKWTGKIPISCFLWRNLQHLQREVENLKLVEDRLDRLIRICARQLFNMTEDAGNAASAYVTHEDIRGLRSVQQKTVILIKAPEETKLDIPAPQESSIQVHLKAGRGPIKVHTCDVGSGDAVTSDPGVFLTLEESRIRTTTLHTASPHGGQSV